MKTHYTVALSMLAGIASPPSRFINFAPESSLASFMTVSSVP